METGNKLVRFTSVNYRGGAFKPTPTAQLNELLLAGATTLTTVARTHPTSQTTAKRSEHSVGNKVDWLHQETRCNQAPPN